MTQAKTQTAEYWGSRFALTESDFEQLYNHFLEVEKPQSLEDLTRVLFQHRVAEEVRSIRRSAKGRQVYQPSDEYELGADIVFPALDFKHGTVTGSRAGFNPEQGDFSVITVDFGGKVQEFASSYEGQHILNTDNGDDLSDFIDLDADQIFDEFGDTVQHAVKNALIKHEDFITQGGKWFVKSLLADISIGHLHLSEAVLEINEGGPLSPDEVLPHLDLDAGIEVGVQRFSLNRALSEDDRFEDVAGEGRVAWFLSRLEPDGVKNKPGRLVYDPVEYDRGLMSPQLSLLEQELDDEWSPLHGPESMQSAVLALTFPHRWAGTLPLSTRVAPLVVSGTSPKQQIILVDEQNGEEIAAWVVREGRYIWGLGDWYQKHKIPVGAFIQLSAGPEPHVIQLGYDKRRAKREWVRLATVANNRLRFELEKRSISCGYDDLMIVGTDVVAAIDAMWKNASTKKRAVASLLIEIFPSLAELTPQNTVHAKTLYSAVNMLLRIPPGPIFVELVRNPAFQTVGDHYWIFDKSRTKANN